MLCWRVGLLVFLLSGLTLTVQAAPDWQAPASTAELQNYRLQQQTLQDPWLWLERDSEQREHWLRAQETAAREWLDALPGRDQWQQRLTRLRDHPLLDLPQQQGAAEFFFFNPGLAPHFDLYRLDSLAADACTEASPCQSLPASASALLTVNDWPENDMLEQLSVHPDGLLLYERGEATGATTHWYLRDEQGRNHRLLLNSDAGHWQELFWSQSGELVLALVEGPQAGLYRSERSALTGPGAGFRRVFSWPDGMLVRAAQRLVDDAVLLALQDADGREQLLYWHPARSQAQLLAEGWLQSPRYIGERKGRLYFISRAAAWRGEIWSVAVDRSDDDRDWRRELAAGDHRLQDARVAASGVVLELLVHASSQLSWLAFDEQDALLPPLSVDMPAVGRIEALTLTHEGAALRFSFSGPIHPPALYDLELGQSAPQRLWQTPIPAAQGGELHVERREVLAADGSALQVYVAGRKEILQRGRAAVLLEAYGGFDLPLDIHFSHSRLAWMQAGGVIALAVVRGGGEYGETWYREGSGQQGWNSVTDLLQIARALRKQGLVADGGLALSGGSHGGTLMAAAASLAAPDSGEPEIAALVLDSPVLDLLRFPLMPPGASWLGEYGDPGQADDFDFLQDFSPYHRLLRGDAAGLPPTLVIASAGDPVVNAAHAYKYVAARQSGASVPVVLRARMADGHQLSAAPVNLIEDYADRWAFLSYFTGLELR